MVPETDLVDARENVDLEICDGEIIIAFPEMDQDPETDFRNAVNDEELDKLIISDCQQQLQNVLRREYETDNSKVDLKLFILELNTYKHKATIFSELHTVYMHVCTINIVLCGYQAVN